MGIGNIGWTEFIVILAIALIFFGPRRLPGIAQALGKSLREFQKALNEVKSEIAQAGREVDVEAAARRPAPDTRIPPRPAERPPSGPAPAAEADREVEIEVEEDEAASDPPAAPPQPTIGDPTGNEPRAAKSAVAGEDPKGDEAKSDETSPEKIREEDGDPQGKDIP